jgi:hypothetical protein
VEICATLTNEADDERMRGCHGDDGGGWVEEQDEQDALGATVELERDDRPIVR